MSRPAPEWVGIVADGIIWQDSDGATAWRPGEANSLAELLETQGYGTSLFESYSGAAEPDTEQCQCEPDATCAHCAARGYPECECVPGAVCAVCSARGYVNGLAGYAARIYPDRVTDDDIETDRRALAADLADLADDDDDDDDGYTLIAGVLYDDTDGYEVTDDDDAEPDWFGTARALARKMGGAE